MHKAIVTGANGFVGSAVCKELVANGVKVIAIVRSVKSDISNISYFSTTIGNVIKTISSSKFSR